MTVAGVYKKIQDHLAQKLPFVMYHKANSDHILALLQDNNQLHDLENYSDSGFIFAPFDSSAKSIFIPEASSTMLTSPISKTNTKKEAKGDFLNDIDHKNIGAKQQHKELIQSAINTIRSNDLRKVVVSRKEEIENDTVYSPVTIFKRLLNAYPSAFTYLWYHPKVGMWLGATPETLLSTVDDQFSTMALAGTQLYQSDYKVNWGDKEIEEQKIVTEFIVNELSSISDTIVSSKTYTHQAGSLLHLRTDIKGNLDQDKYGVEKVISMLHPTPAVCGLPKNEARTFILANEKYNRKYYTGYLGELNLGDKTQKKSNLFVNLRCMELESKKAILYVGGGITKDSDPEKEWEETVRKTETIKKVLF